MEDKKRENLTDLEELVLAVLNVERVEEDLNEIIDSMTLTKISAADKGTHEWSEIAAKAEMLAVEINEVASLSEEQADHLWGLLNTKYGEDTVTECYHNLENRPEASHKARTAEDRALHTNLVSRLIEAVAIDKDVAKTSLTAVIRGDGHTTVKRKEDSGSETVLIDFSDNEAVYEYIVKVSVLHNAQEKEIEATEEEIHEQA